MNKLAKPVTLLLDPPEHDELLELARAAGETVPEYIRRSVKVRGQIEAAPSKGMAEMARRALAEHRDG
jgi:hypothetical protein